MCTRLLHSWCVEISDGVMIHMAMIDCKNHCFVYFRHNHFELNFEKNNLVDKFMPISTFLEDQ